jgi:hypothetical protein
MLIASFPQIVPKKQRTRITYEFMLIDIGYPNYALTTDFFNSTKLIPEQKTAITASTSSSIHKESMKDKNSSNEPHSLKADITTVSD